VAVAADAEVSSVERHDHLTTVNRQSKVQTMTKQFLALLAGGAFLALASTANAAGPMQLSDNQMDAVSAGSTAIANGVSAAFGEAFSDTASLTSTNVSRVSPEGVHSPLGQIVIAQSFSQGLAAGGFLFQAAAASHSDSLAQW